MQIQSMEILQKLIAYPTITPNECGIFNYICSLLPDFTPITLEEKGVKNLFLYKTFKDGVHLCFGGHIDVVPPGEGWSVDPFVPTLKEGFLYGRGSEDMKGGISAFIAAIREFSKQYTANASLSNIGTLSILLTSDEEGDAVYGTKAMLEHLSSIQKLPHCAIVAEPTSGEQLGDEIKVGRRGSINGVLILLGKQGHVAYPQKCLNPTETLISILPKIAGYDLDKGDSSFEPTKIVITDIRGGIEAVNVTPNELKIMFNIRNSPQTTFEMVEEYFKTLLWNIPNRLTLKESSKPFLTNLSSPVITTLTQQITALTQQIPRKSCSGGTSDARYFAEYGIDVVECGVCNDKIHAIDERVKVSDIEKLEKVFYSFLCNFRG